jgi:O-antigen/teichoic acid export membrane protein
MKSLFPHRLRRVSDCIPTGPLYGIVDQALLSATNFAVGIFLIHFAEKEQYGLYSLAYGILTLIISFAGALITTPMTVNCADRPAEQRARYCASMLFGQYWIFGPTIGVALAIMFLLYQFRVLQWQTMSFAAVVAAASLGVMLWEFSRRYYYLRLRPKQVLHWDICYAAMMVIGLIVVACASLSDMHQWVFVVYGLAAVGTGLQTLAGSGLNIRLRLVEVATAVREAWLQGRWALCGVMVTWVQSQSFAYFLLMFSSLASVADANAARLLLAPLMFVNTGLSNVVLPQLVLLRSKEGLTATVNLARQLMLGLMGFFLVYTVLVLLAQEMLIALILGESYTGIEPFIFAWAAVNVLTVLRSNSSLLLQVFKEFRAITLANIGSALVVVGITWPFIHYYGVLGSIAALAVGELILALLLWGVVAHVRQRYAD